MPNVRQIAKSLLLRKKYITSNSTAIELAEKGCKKLGFKDLFETESDLLIYQSIVRDRDKLLNYLKLHPQDPEHKNVFYASHFLGTPLPSLLSFAYHPKIQIAAWEYFKKPFFLYSSDIWISVPSSQKASSSQLWHRDPESKKMLKMFLNLNNVTEREGPTEFIEGTHRTGRDSQLAQHQARSITINTDKLSKLEKHRTLHVTNSCGDTGDLTIVDTSGIHRGGLCQSERHVANLCFLPFYSGKYLPCHASNHATQ